MVIRHEKASTVKNTLKRFSIYVLALLLLIGIASGSLHIRSYAPLESNVSNIEGDTREFYIKVNQIANISWYINGTNKQDNSKTDDSTYTKTSADAGTWIVNATASNEHDTVSQEWTWIVRRYGVNLTVDSTSKISSAGTNASYLLLLQNNGTATDTYNLTVVNTDNAAIAALNISQNLTLEPGASQALLLNITNMSSGISGIFRVNITARSNNDTRKVGYINTTTTVTAVRGVNFTNISQLSNTTIARTNLTYFLSLKNTGTDIDSYNLAVTPGGESVASLNITSPITLNSNETRIFKLNVTNTSAGIFQVNITVTSAGNATIFAFINTTTNVTVLRAVNLTNIDSLEKTVIAGTNATYILSLINNGSDADSYNLSVTAGGALVALLNVTSVSLNAGETSFFELNVTNTSAGIFQVNITVTSNGDDTKLAYLNTTTNVTAFRGVNLTNISVLSKTTAAGTNATYYLSLTNNGSDIDSYNLTVTPDGASVTALNFTSPISLNASETRIFTLNVTNMSSGTFHVNVTAWYNDTSKIDPINTTTIIPIVINITNPANGSITTDNYVNVTVILDADGLAQYLNWEGVNYTMIPNTSHASGTVFFMNMTDLLSGNYTFKIYANDTDGNNNVSETRTVRVDGTIVNNLSIDPITGYVNQTVISSSPGGNVTITIFNGTNATLSDGTPISNITINSLNNMNPKVMETLGSDKLVGENLSLGPEGARFSPDIQIRFNYTDAMLLSAGITPLELRIKLFNPSTNTWVTQTPYTLNETGKYIMANVSHFSTFALVGTTMTPTRETTSGGGGSSGGGGGVLTLEPYENIARSETYEKSLIYNIPVIYTFKLSEHAIFEIAITGKENVNNVALKIEALKGPTKITGISAPPGTVYKNMNIWAGSKRIKEGLIRFKVLNIWILNNNVESGDLRLVKWDGSQWVKLVTLETMKDDTNTFYEANTDSFASFAITALKGEVVPTATPETEDTDETGIPAKPAGIEDQTPGPTNKIPGFEVIIPVFIIGLLAVGFRKYLR